MFPPHFTCLYTICVMQTLRCSNPESDSVKRSKKLLDKHPARPLPLLSSTEGSVMPVHPTGDCRREIEFVGESSFCILIQVCYLSRERVERGGGIGCCRSFALALAFPPSLHFFSSSPVVCHGLVLGAITSTYHRFTLPWRFIYVFGAGQTQRRKYVALYS